MGRMHAREQEVSNALAETSTFVMNHFQVSVFLAAIATACPSVNDDCLSTQSWSMSSHKPVTVLVWLVTTLRLSASALLLRCCSCALPEAAGG